MNLKLIACKVLQREIASLICTSPNVIDLTMLRQSFHEVPSRLNSALQEEIDRIESGSDPHTNDLEHNDLDGILIGYGLCSNAVLGLKSRRYPIIIPRAHDCATLVLGSKERYQKYFETHSGYYFYSQGWLDLGVRMDAATLEQKRQQYMEQFDDEDAVAYLMEIEKDMLRHYKGMTYISWNDLDQEGNQELVRQMAEEKSWDYQHIEGDASLLRDLIDGNWDEERFIIVKPGEEVVSTGDDRIIAVKKS